MFITRVTTAVVVLATIGTLTVAAPTLTDRLPEPIRAPFENLTATRDTLAAYPAANRDNFDAFADLFGQAPAAAIETLMQRLSDLANLTK